MKKLLFILCGLVITLLVWIYLFIPSTIKFHGSVQIEANRNGLFRKLEHAETWQEWWPGATTGIETFSLNGINFRPGQTKILSIPLIIDDPDLSGSAELMFIPNKLDSTIIQVDASIPVPTNPLKRMKTYFASRKLKQSLPEILQALHKTYSKISNVYDYDIRKDRVVDSILIFTSEETKGYPSVEKIYSLIDQLKMYIKAQSAVETGFPMQNIYTNDSVNYLIKVAIPVNKRLPDTDKFRYRWMLGGGNILITEVKGGQTEISRAYGQILNYISDYNRTAPAIYFESLVTDRRKEPDSSKWITRIYYPVM
ncbi:MAG: GyrI-like domain-containing protein [Bacteroidetes bacterium]|jgi:effector-binding domain-containing protein|nr:MAG: GyrI-like domain-containing protein [Bacteroidota bacterium]